MAKGWGTRVKGLDEAANNLNAEIGKIEGKTMAGLFAAGLVIQAESQRRVPVEYGNLRGSAYTRRKLIADKKRGMVTQSSDTVEVGYSAAYAIYVHENMEQTLKGQPRPSGLGVYWGPEGEPKFLENAMMDKKDEVLHIIAAYVRV